MFIYGQMEVLNHLLLSNMISPFKVNYRGRRQVLVRCRNPWGGNYEWRGPWSDRSKEWDDVSAAEKKQLDLTFRDDGEFW